MSLLRILHKLSLSNPSHVSNRNIYSALGRRSLSSTTTMKVTPECTNTTTKCVFSNPPYPIPRNKNDDLSIQRRQNQYYGEKYLNSTVRFLIHNLSDLDKAMYYARLTTFTETRGATTTATCDLIISALCEAKRYTDAYTLFHYFFNVCNIELGATCCNHIVKALCDDGRAHEALELHHHIRRRRNISLDFQTYRLLAKCLYYDGKNEEVLDLVKELFPVTFTDPEDHDFVVSKFLERADFDRGWALWCAAFFQMSDDNYNTSYPTVTKDAVTVSFLEYSFSRGKEDTAMEFYKYFDKVGGAIENASKKPILEVLFKYGKVKEAWSLFHKMIDVPYFADEESDTSESINVMINELFKLGMTEEAIDAFVKVRGKQGEFMNKFRHVPYSNFITRCCENPNLLSTADCYFRELLEENPSACKMETFKEMISAYLKAGRVDDALNAANKMVDANLRQVSSLLDN